MYICAKCIDLCAKCIQPMTFIHFGGGVNEGRDKPKGRKPMAYNPMHFHTCLGGVNEGRDLPECLIKGGGANPGRISIFDPPH